MKKIKAYVNYNDRSKTHYYKNFDIIEKLPEVEATKKFNGEVVKIEQIELDCEQPSQEVYNYNYYKITKIDYGYYQEELIEYEDSNLEDYTYYEYVAVEKEDE